MGAVKLSQEGDMVDFLTALLALSSIAVHGVAALQCIQCTSDPSAPNQDCIGNENGTMALDVVSTYTLPCDPKYGDEFCYTMITAEPADVVENEAKRWNRGCCNRNENSTVCPSDKPDHVNSAPWWEVWRKRCTEDACNMDAPRGSSQGDTGGGAGFNMCDTLDSCRLLVSPRSSAERIALLQNLFAPLVVMFLIK